MNEAPPSLSVCVIAKNEETNLRRCLASVESVADEVLLTDTGSTDDTVVVGQQAGADVDFFDWVDDFSAAYNHVAARATKEWVLLLDADEALLPESEQDLRRAMSNEKAFAYTVLRQDLYETTDQKSFTEMLQTRLWRRHEAARFVGRIHHQFSPPLQELAAARGQEVLPSAIRLRHWGYAGSNKRPKLERAERLMTLELEDRPNQFYYLVELGRTRLALGDDSGVELLKQAAEQAVANDRLAMTNPGQFVQLLEHLLAADLLPDSFPLTRDEAERLATERFPRSVPLLWQQALSRYKRGRFSDCAKLLERILHLAETDGYDRLASFPPSIMRSDATLNLGACYTRMGRLRDALRCFDALVDDPKHGRAAASNARSIRQLANRR